MNKTGILSLHAPAVAGKRGGEIAAYRPVPVNGEYSAELKRILAEHPAAVPQSGFRGQGGGGGSP